MIRFLRKVNGPKSKQVIVEESHPRRSTHRWNTPNDHGLRHAFAQTIDNLEINVLKIYIFKKLNAVKKDANFLEVLITVRGLTWLELWKKKTCTSHGALTNQNLTRNNVVK